MRYLQARIEHYKKLTLDSLDKDDSSSAIKNRAIQKELETILVYFQNNLRNSNSYSGFYSSSEVAKILETSISTANRKHLELNACMIKGKWLFPKEIVDNYANYYAQSPRRGRKPKQLLNQKKGEFK